MFTKFFPGLKAKMKKSGNSKSEIPTNVRRSPRLNQGNSNGNNSNQSIGMASLENSPKPIKKADNKTCLAYEERCMLHKCSEIGGHPERPERIKRIFDKLTEEGLVDRCVRVKSRPATLEEVLLVHEEKYVKEFSMTKDMETGELKSWQDKWNSIYIHIDTWDAALLAVGNLLECVESVVNGNTLNGAAVIRPPGHHAEPDQAYGFCFFNNVAIAAQYARKMLGIGKILILDWDVSISSVYF